MAKPLARLRRARMKQQQGCCYYCGQPMWQGSDGAFCRQFSLTRHRAALFQCTAEHLTARSAGGGNGAANIVAACRFCNETRHKARQPKEPDSYRAFVQRRLARGGWQRLTCHA
jgi:5-methylcytosine-specific restriction endonuclease McrA